MKVGRLVFYRPSDIREWLASRKEAGLKIDIKTCEVGSWHAYDLDPYGLDPDLPEELQQIGRNHFVRSPESRGWISVDDLPPEKIDALYDRFERRRQN